MNLGSSCLSLPVVDGITALATSPIGLSASLADSFLLAVFSHGGSFFLKHWAYLINTTAFCLNGPVSRSSLIRHHWFRLCVWGVLEASLLLGFAASDSDLDYCMFGVLDHPLLLAFVSLFKLFVNFTSVSKVGFLL